MSERSLLSANRARLQVVVAALLFSTGGVAIKGATLDGWQIACFRSAVAAVVMVMVMPSAWRALRGPAWLVGIPFGGTMVLYALANKATTAANAIFLQDTAPLYVLLLAPWLLGEHARGRDLGVMVALGVGLVLILFGGEAASTTAPAPLRGNLLGAAAGLCWALTVIGLRRVQQGREGPSALASAAAAAVAGNLLAALVSAPMALAVTWSGTGGDLSLANGLIVGYLGAVQIALAYVFLNAGIGRLRAFEASLLLLIEPVFSTVWAWMLLGEHPGIRSLLGAAIIVSATAIHAWPRRASKTISTARLG